MTYLKKIDVEEQIEFANKIKAKYPKYSKLADKISSSLAKDIVADISDSELDVEEKSVSDSLKDYKNINNMFSKIYNISSNLREF